MDFGTIKKKLNQNIYQNVEGFLNDMSQVFINCRRYNGTESPVGRIGVNIRHEYNRLLGMYNFVERFQNSQQVHPSVLFIKDLQSNKPPSKPAENSKPAIIKSPKSDTNLPLIPEVDLNKTVQKPENHTQPNQSETNGQFNLPQPVQSLPEIKADATEQSNPDRIQEETKDEPGLVSGPEPIQIEQPEASPNKAEPEQPASVAIEEEDAQNKETEVEKLKEDSPKPVENSPIETKETQAVEETSEKKEAPEATQPEPQPQLVEPIRAENESESKPEKEPKKIETSEDSLLGDSPQKEPAPVQTETADNPVAPGEAGDLEQKPQADN